MTGESAEEAFERGSVAGKIDARLDDHDKHFKAINGSLERMANELHGLRLEVQRLGDQAVSRDATVITTAAALKDAESARRRQAEQNWSPWAKIFAAAAGMAAIIGLVLMIRGWQ